MFDQKLLELTSAAFWSLFSDVQWAAHPQPL